MRQPINTRRAGALAEKLFYTERYPRGYQHGNWADHIERVAASVEFLKTYAPPQTRTVADLSCGDGAIPLQYGNLVAANRIVLGDINPNAQIHLTVFGALPDTLEELPVEDPVDLYVCSETIEHVPDPDFLLQEIRKRARHLFLSTPLSEPVDHGNPEHYWSWDADGVREMLEAAGWTPVEYRVFVPEFRPPSGYDFQFWMCK